MDDTGFIFTVDAVLALIVVIVLTATITAYTLLPYYQGEDHQHLEALADSVLESMEQSGQLHSDAVYYSSGCSTYIANANNDLNSTLGTLIPQGVAYSMMVNINGTTYVITNTTNTRNLATSNDQVTKVKVISAPQEGWMGRAYYKLDKVDFVNVDQTAVTTVWNFHNWLSNFQPWGNGLNTYKYWGGTSSSSQTAAPINFIIPSTGSINSAQFLLGSAYDNSYSNQRAYNATFVLNGNQYNVLNSSFNYLYNAKGNYMWNYLGNIDTSQLNTGQNSFYVQFKNAVSQHNMPWFSIIANYTTSMSVPQGTQFQQFGSNDIAGVGNPSGGLLYNLNTGQKTSTTGRSISWSTLQSSDYDLSTPFEITGMPGISSASAVGTTMNVYLPNNTNLYDAFVVVNAYGGEDGAMVQVKNSLGQWNTVFSSFGYTARNDGGYGNVPGIVSLYDKYNSTYQSYLTPGNNVVRVITWDDSLSGDYDLVGLKNCYTQLAYSTLPLRWDDYCFSNYQNDSSSSTKSLTENKAFNIDAGAQNAFLFLGAGLDTRNIIVKASNGTASNTLYNGPPQYMLDLASLDNAQTTKILTYTNASGTILPKAGNYTLTVSVTPSYAYESGDLSTNTGSYGYLADPELYSGTRIAVLYPQFLANVWSVAFNDTAQGAMTAASNILTANLTSQGFTVKPAFIKTEAIWTGDSPNAVSIRLTLWKQ